ncbi:glycosyl hydrolase family 32 [Saccharopolyspora taberi]|uniref:Glycosyl hydrolase family 32 N-terminal domain-containing protein n=1 Tax=Saccharopolyspora taberi TaxID=60895 RepID=A0ABN3VJ22_9PSEU
MDGSRVDRRSFLALSAGAGAVLLGSGSASARGRPAVPAAGEFVRIYDPSEDVPWYINDHCLVRADGWHLFGITHEEPADPENEHLFAHATAPSPHGPWRKRPMALTVDPGYGETHLWAPHVVPHNGTYHMFYAGGGHDRTRTAINLATSTDLFTWTRHPGGPLFHDGYEARDPFVTRIGGRWVCYYTATDDPSGGHHVVAYRTSRDLIRWSSRRVAFTSSRVGTAGGDAESPYVVRHGGDFYLFAGPCGAYDGTPEGYSCTAVYRSPNPFDFPLENRVAKIPAHAPELLHDSDGWWITHCGWGQGGVHLAPLTWHP